MRVLLSAAEPSGDAIGARLADGFRQMADGGVIAGSAGPRMAAAGVRALADAWDFSHAGWSSVAARLPWLAWKAWLYFRAVDRFRPDLALVVDAPGLHGPLLRRLRRRGTRAAWVAPPQLWAWKNRSPALLRGMEVYPAHGFEVEALADAGAQAFWWGYPGPRPDLSLRAAPNCLAVLPGSRGSWRQRHRELFVAAARRSGLRLEIVLVHPQPPPSGTESGLVCLPPALALPRAALAISLPGTATLETALWGVPTLVAARPGRIDLWMARRRLADGARALPNRILGERVFPERYGPEVAVESLAAGLVDLYQRRSAIATRLDGFEARLGRTDAASAIVGHFLRS
jgi:lipid-A-disaccharide synthase